MKQIRAYRGVAKLFQNLITMQDDFFQMSIDAGKNCSHLNH